MFLLKWLLNAASALLQKIPPPRSKQIISPNLITPEQALTINERDIIARAEESFKALEAQSQAVMARIQASPVIAPEPAPVTLAEVPEFLEISAPAPAAEVSEVPDFGVSAQSNEILEISVSEPVVEVSEVPEILEISAVPAEPLQAEAPTPAGWAAIEAGSETTAADFGVRASSEPQPNSAQSNAPPAMTRSQLVESLLDEAWQQGITTYTALMAYVESQTGKGCSKRVVSAWKKARHLAAAA